MRTLLSLACLALLALPSSARPISGNLESALESVLTERISSDVYFIAAPELAGRDTPSRGLRIAARYIRARLQRLGWQPGAQDGYFYEYPLIHNMIDAEASGLILARPEEGEIARLRFGHDYFVGLPVDSRVTGPVVYCGEGRKEDFERAEVEGAWAFTIEGVSSHRRRSQAIKAGAVGLLSAPDPEEQGLPLRERFAGQLREPRRGRLEYPDELGRLEPRAVFPDVYLGRQGATKIFAGAGLDFADRLPKVGARMDVELTELRARPGENGRIQVENVCGFWPGSDPVLKHEVILVTAHYDHEGVIRGEIYPGADDNASGSSGLLALAEALTRRGPLRRSVMLIWVSGEEKGLYGSKAWSEKPWLPEGCRAVLDINVDMIGRNAPDELYITPSPDHRAYNGLVKLAREVALLEGFGPLGSADKYYRRSDHIMFAQLGIPVAFLFAEVHEDYHRPTDTPDKVDCDKVRRVVRLILRMLEGLQADELGL